MANQCLPQVQACRLRVARLEPNGVPDPGANNLYVSDALVSLGFSWQTEAGDEINEKNGCGETLVNFRAPPTLLRGEITIKILTPDPQLSELLSGGVVLTSGADVGYGAPALGVVDTDPISIEVWAKQLRDGKQDTSKPWAWWAYPWVQYLRPADHTQQNANMAMEFVGEAYQNENWLNGPANDWPTDSDRVYQWMPTAVIPAAACGYATLAAS